MGVFCVIVCAQDKQHLKLRYVVSRSSFQLALMGVAFYSPELGFFTAIHGATIRLGQPAILHLGHFRGEDSARPRPTRRRILAKRVIDFVRALNV